MVSRVLAEHCAGGRLRALSAGTQPGEGVHPEVVRVLARLGLDTVADPGGQDDATVRAVVADLDARVRDLVRGLVPDLELPPSVRSGA